MGYSRKRNISGVLCLLSTVVVIFCIWKIIPSGMAGNAGTVKRYAAVAAPTLVVGLISGVTYYYYRNKDDYGAAAKANIEITALSQAGRKNGKNSRNKL